MSYSDSIVRDLMREPISKKCFICKHEFGINEYRAHHSGTGLHLVLEEAEDPVRYVYRSTDPPAEYSNLKDKIFEVNAFLFGMSYFADAVCVCHHCHKEIHRLALRLCRRSIPGFKGNTPTPTLLVEATYNFHKYWKRLA